MIRKLPLLLSFTCIALISLSACEQAREELGLNRQSPDEFSVLKRAPLTLPPSYDLRPPRSEALNATSVTQTGQSQARRVLLGQNNTDNSGATSSPSTGTQILLDQAGANQTQADIRGKLNSESAVLSTTDRTVAERLLFWSGDDASTSNSDAEQLDPNLEAQRLNQEGIKAPTPGLSTSEALPAEVIE